MENRVEKPISVARYEFVQQITSVINGSNLPMCIIESVMKDMYADVKIVAQRQLESDMKAYQTAIENMHNSQETADTNEP